MIATHFEKDLIYQGLTEVPWDSSRTLYHRADDHEVQVYYTKNSHEIRYTAVPQGSATYVYEYYDGFNEIRDPQERTFKSFRCATPVERDSEYFY